MSYELVKRIEVRANRVFIKCASNNVCPKTYQDQEFPRLTAVYQKDGQRGLDIVLMEQYEQGNFQAGTKNRYSRAVNYLRTLPDFKKFDWRENWDTTAKIEYRNEYEALLIKALNVVDSIME
jgi:hypothetical protein